MARSADAVSEAEQDGTLPPVRLPRALLDQARAEAKRRDETLSQVIRRALRAYVGAAPRQTDLEDAIRGAKRKG